MTRNQIARNQVINILLAILHPFDSQKCETQQQRDSQKDNLRATLPDLSVIDRQRHRHTATDEHYRVDGSEPDVKVITRGSEGRRVFRAKDRVGEKQPAEEHDLLREKDPHPNRASLALLLQVIEMVRQRRLRVMFFYMTDCQCFTP